MKRNIIAAVLCVVGYGTSGRSGPGVMAAQAPLPVAETPSPATQRQTSDAVFMWLANANPAELDFEGGVCNRTGGTMLCTFQQVLMAPDPDQRDTCRVSTHRYELTFARQSPTQWVSNQGPTGLCGLIEITILDEARDAGSNHWTMNSRKIVTTRTNPDPLCQLDEPPDLMTWQAMRRALPCRFIAPGAIEP